MIVSHFNHAYYAIDNPVMVLVIFKKKSYILAYSYNLNNNNILNTLFLRHIHLTQFLPRPLLTLLGDVRILLGSKIVQH